MKSGTARDEGSPVAGVMRAIWPSVSLVLAVLFAVSPGGVTGLPVGELLPVAVIFFWSIRGEAALPALVIFACGTMLDALAYGPAGYWALVYLVTGQMAAMVGEFANGGFVARTAMLAACLALACGVQAGVLAVFGVQLPGVAEMVSAGLVIVVAYPLIAWVLSAGAGRTGTAGGNQLTTQHRS